MIARADKAADSRFPKLLLVGLLVPLLVAAIPLFRGDIAVVRIWDDALFFVRYAENFVATGRFSWNAGEPPVFGATSQLFQVMTALMVAVLPGHPDRCGILLSAGMGLATVVILLFMVGRLLRGEGMRLATAAFAALVIGFNPKFVSGHFLNGMETTTSAAAVAILLWVTTSSSGSRWYWRAFIPAITVVLVWVRPDLILFLAFLVPLGLTLLPGRRVDAFIGAFAAAGLIAASGLFWWYYYGTPVPLPAIIKTFLTPYAKAAVATYSYGNIPELFLMIRENAVTLLLAIYFFVRRGVRAVPVDAALILGTLLFLAFEVVGNRLPVANGDARFLMPALPVLLWYGIRGFHDSVGDLAGSSHPPVGRRAAPAFAVSVIAVTCLLLIPPLAQRVVPLVVAAAREAPRSDHDAVVTSGVLQRKWPILDALLTAQTENCSIADTEVGVIGVVPASRRVLDMSGLNSTELALRRDDAAGYLVKSRPDIIWYKRVGWYWGVDLDADPRLTREYAFHPREGIAVRLDSPCRPPVEKALAALPTADAQAPHATGAPF